MNKLNKHEFTGKWISGPKFNYGQDDALYYKSNPNYVFSKKFMISSTKDAVIYIAAFGFYICKINGKRISDFELNSDWTTYSKRIYYDKINVEEYLNVGENTIEIEMGNGMANPSPMKLFGKYNLRERLSDVNDPSICVDLVAKDFGLISDQTWNVSQGTLIANNYYIGEIVDFRNVTFEKTKALEVEFANDIELVESYIPKCKRQFELKPINTEVAFNQIVIDFGQTISGFINIDLHLQSAKDINIIYAETKDEGKLNLNSAVVGNVGMKIADFVINGGEGAPQVPYQRDIIMGASGVNTFTNKFTYHSFRYAVVSGCSHEEIADISAIAVYTDIEKVGHVETDNLYLNQLFDAATNTKYNNIHSVFEDCAREKLAYGGDMVALFDSNQYLLNLDEMIRKTADDFRLEQTVDGGVPETAPYMGIQTNGTADKEGPILWQFVYPHFILNHYKLYGDAAVLEDHIINIQKQMNYLRGFDFEKLANCCLGDHGSPEIRGEFKSATPDKLLVGYCTIAMFYQTNIEILTALNQDSSELESELAKLRTEIDKKFQNEDGSYGDKTQTSYAFALKLNLGNRETLKEKLASKLEEDKYIFTTGIFGAAFLYEELNKLNRNDLVEKWLDQESEISFKQMLKNEDKVLSELFVSNGQKYYSANHAMFSSYQQWYFEALAGVRLADDAIGFNKIDIKPYPSSMCNKIKASIKTINGILEVNLKRDGDIWIYELSYPSNIELNIDTTSLNVLESKLSETNYKLIYTTK